MASAVLPWVEDLTTDRHNIVVPCGIWRPGGPTRPRGRPSRVVAVPVHPSFLLVLPRYLTGARPSHTFRPFLCVCVCVSCCGQSEYLSRIAYHPELQIIVEVRRGRPRSPERQSQKCAELS